MLAVVADAADPVVVGTLTEAHLLKRYCAELERRQDEIILGR